MKAFDANYPGDTRYTAAVDHSGNMIVVEQPSGDVRSVPAKTAKRIVADLENAGNTRGYDGERIEAVQHFILARAFEQRAM